MDGADRGCSSFGNPVQEVLMSVPDSPSAAPAAEARHQEPTPRTAPSGWVVGMAPFAAVVMIVSGIFEVLQGLAALFRNEVYVAGPRYIYIL